MALDPRLALEINPVDTVSASTQMVNNERYQDAQAMEQERLQMERERQEIAKIKSQFDMSSELEKKEALEDVSFSYKLANASSPEEVDRLLSTSGSEHALEYAQMWSQNPTMENIDFFNSAKEDVVIADMIGIIDMSGSKGTSTSKFERNRDRWLELEKKSGNLTQIEAKEKELLRTALETEARGGMDAEQRAFGNKLGGSRGTEYAGLEQVQAEAQEVSAQLDLLENAVEKLGFRQGPLIGKTPNLTTEAQIVDSQGVKDALKFVNQTKGAVSDKEMAMFKSVAVGTDKKYEFNKNTVAMARAILKRKVEQAAFFQDWYQKNGTLEGASKTFKDWAEQNPAFTVDGTNVKLTGSDNTKKTKSGISYKVVE
jgi:hypothetical protein